MSMQLSKIEVSRCGRYHHYDGKPLYDKLFLQVGKFHEPGLAPAVDYTGAFHIDTTGKPIYEDRFDETYGFYEGLATVCKSKRFFHINQDGFLVHRNKFEWAGNFNEGACPVLKGNGFYHVNKNGTAIYNKIYDYVGDFKDGIAVVYLNGRATHIQIDGKYLHNKWFYSCGIYHKRIARVEDEKGWYHIDYYGMPLYNKRFKMLEDFYNGLALAETTQGELIRINESGEPKNFIRQNGQDYTDVISSEMIGFWNIYIYYCFVIYKFYEILPAGRKKLEKATGIPSQNLTKILGAFEELGLVNYWPKTYIWELTPKGKFLSEYKNGFLLKAALMWKEVANLKWQKLPDMLKEKFSSHPTFKALEKNREKSEAYQEALEGYFNHELKNYLEKSNIINNSENVLLIGRSSVPIKNLPIYSSKCKFTGLFPDSKMAPAKLPCFYSIEKLEGEYDCAWLVKYLNGLDDEKITELLNKLSQLKIKRINIIEFIREAGTSDLSMLDLNLLVESGGKIREYKELNKLLEENEYKITYTDNINKNMSFISAKFCRRIY